MWQSQALSGPASHKIKSEPSRSFLRACSCLVFNSHQTSPSQGQSSLRHPPSFTTLVCASSLSEVEFTALSPRYCFASPATDTTSDMTPSASWRLKSTRPCDSNAFHQRPQCDRCSSVWHFILVSSCEPGGDECAFPPLPMAISIRPPSNVR